MVTDVPTIAAPPVTDTSAAGADSAGFDERRAEPQAKAHAHDRAIRRNLAFSAPILLLAAAVVAYAFSGR